MSPAISSRPLWRGSTPSERRNGSSITPSSAKSDAARSGFRTEARYSNSRVLESFMFMSFLFVRERWTPLRARPEGRIPRSRHAWSPYLRGLLSGAKKTFGIDDGQPLGIITALETERLVLGADNMHRLSRD